MDVVCIGDCGIDRYLPSGEERVGGITANFAVHARRAFDTADRVRIVAPLGDDGAARTVRKHFEGIGIDCHFIGLHGRTPVQDIEIDASGERRFVGYDEGVLADYRFDRPEMLADLGLLVTPVFAQNRDMFASVMATPTDAIRAVDFADFAEHPDFGLFDAFADDIDIAFFGLSDDSWAVIDELRSIARGTDIVAIVTLGADGSLALADDGDHRCPAEPVGGVVDTTGAGDAFAAGFLGNYCRGGDISAALRSGSRLAAAAVQSVGGHDLANL